MNTTTKRNEYGMPDFIADRGSTIAARIAYHINQPLPWFVLIAMMAGFTLAYAIRTDSRTDARLHAAETIASSAAMRSELSARSAEAIAQSSARAAEALAQASMDKATIAEREARMQQYYILELDAKLIAAEIELPDRGYQRFREKRQPKQEHQP